MGQALALLGEMNTNVQHVGQLVDTMLLRVRKGELSTTQGLSFLEMKYHMLLSYLINVTYVVLRKCSGEKIEGDPSIERLVEIRTVLEKIRPIDHKLKYQIDKLVKAAVVGTVDENDHSAFRANPANLNGDENSEEDEEEIDDAKKEKSGSNASNVYVPPKLAAVHYDMDESAADRNKRLQEYKKKHNLHASVMEDLREEYLDTPKEVSQGSRAEQSLSRYEQEKQEFEENYLTRLPETKAEKSRRNRVNTIGNLGDQIIHGIGGTAGNSKRKRKVGKAKGKGNKRRRFH